MQYAIKGEVFYTTRCLANLAKKFSAGKILDAGCGTGEYFPYYNGTEIYGVDLTARYLKKIPVKKYKQKISLKKADVRKLPFKANTFDFVLCAAVLEYMQNKKELDKAVNELKRVLKPHGMLVVSVPHKNNFTEFIRKDIIGKFISQNAKDPYFIMGKEYTDKTMKSYGFTIHGCLGWVTSKNINNSFISNIIDTVFWYVPALSGTLVGVYEKK